MTDYSNRPAGGPPSSSRIFRQYYSAILILSVLFLGGVQLPIIGTAYVLDFIAPAVVGFMVLFDGRVREQLGIYMRSILVGGCVVLAFTCLDLFNQIDSQWMWRGFGRNLGCYFSFVFGLCVLTRFGLRNLFLLWTVVALSIPCYLLLSGAPEVRSLETFFKFYNGTAIIIPIVAFVRRSRPVTIAIFITYAAFLYVACDCRSAATVALAVGLWLFALPWISRIKPWLVGIALLLIAPLAINGALAYARSLAEKDVDRTDRMAMSDSVRSEMALDAVVKIEARPLTGYGSWQHVMLFESVNDIFSNAVQGVHSIPLQLGFEYGLLGLTMAAIIAILLLRVATRLSYWRGTTGEIPRYLLPLCMYLLIVIVNNFVFGALMGFDRFTFGLGLAYVVWANRTLGQAIQASRTFRPFSPIYVGATHSVNR